MTAPGYVRVHRSRGLTLVEMLVASMTIAIVVGAVGSIYVATLRLWNQGSAEDIANQKATWVLTRATADFRSTMQVVDFGPHWVLARLPKTTWDATLGTRMNVVSVDSDGELFLEKGNYVSYFIGDEQGNMDANGTSIWRRVYDENGGDLETRQLTDGVLPNPIDPDTGAPRSFINYWPVFETGRAIEMTLTVEHKMGPKRAQVTLRDWFMLRNR